MKWMMKPAAIGLFGLFFVLACGQGGGRGNMMMSNDQMMEQMRSNPQMMDQIMSNPDMMQQMMGQMMMSPEQCASMAEYMAKNPEACRNMMKAMANRMPAGSAEHMLQQCQVMTPSGLTPSPAPSEPVSESTTGDV